MVAPAKTNMEGLICRNGAWSAPQHARPCAVAGTHRDEAAIIVPEESFVREQDSTDRPRNRYSSQLSDNALLLLMLVLLPDLTYSSLLK